MTVLQLLVLLAVVRLPTEISGTPINNMKIGADADQEMKIGADADQEY